MISGVSKAYSMTCWRIRYADGPEQLIKTMAMIQPQGTTNPSSVNIRTSPPGVDFGCYQSN